MTTYLDLLNSPKGQHLRPIIQAYDNGKEIQFLSPEGEWTDVASPSFYTNLQYREKPTQPEARQ